MRKIKINSLKARDEYAVVDWKDEKGLFKAFDSELEKFGLELVLGDNSDDNYWVRIEKRQKTKNKRKKNKVIMGRKSHGSGRVGYFPDGTKYKDLVQVFGQPNRDPDCLKTDVEWCGEIDGKLSVYITIRMGSIILAKTVCR